MARFYTERNCYPIRRQMPLEILERNGRAMLGGLLRRRRLHAGVGVFVNDPALHHEADMFKRANVG